MSSMRLLVLDEELIAGGVETLRIHLIPELAIHCEKLVWVLPAHGIKRLVCQMKLAPQIEIEPLHWPTLTPCGLLAALLRRVQKWIPRQWKKAISDWLRNTRIRQLANQHGCTHLLTTCVFSQPLPPPILPSFGIISDVNPAIPEPIRDNISKWVQKAHGIFSISDFTRHNLLRLNPGCESKVVTLHLAAPPSPTKDLRDQPKSFDFYYPAAPNPHKNHSVLFRACLNLAQAGIDFRLAISGPGTEGFLPGGHFDDGPMQEARDFLIQHAPLLGTRIVILGSLAPGEVSKVFAKARSIVLPSEYEGFGLPLVEALANGLPVICSDIAPFQELLDLYAARDMARIVRTGDCEQLAAAMSDFLINKEKVASTRVSTEQQMARWTWADAGRCCFKYLSA